MRGLKGHPGIVYGVVMPVLAAVATAKRETHQIEAGLIAVPVIMIICWSCIFWSAYTRGKREAKAEDNGR